MIGVGEGISHMCSPVTLRRLRMQHHPHFPIPLPVTHVSLHSVETLKLHIFSLTSLCLCRLFPSRKLQWCKFVFTCAACGAPVVHRFKIVKSLIVTDVIWIRVESISHVQLCHPWPSPGAQRSQFLIHVIDLLQDWVGHSTMAELFVKQAEVYSRARPKFPIWEVTDWSARLHGKLLVIVKECFSPALPSDP